MKYHKIPGIDKSVCTKEQKIAYNMAFSIHVGLPRDYENMDAIGRAAYRNKAIRTYLDNFSKTYPDSVVNLDGVFSALSAGLEKYLDKFFIATDYETIGRAFPALYI